LERTLLDVRSWPTKIPPEYVQENLNPDLFEVLSTIKPGRKTEDDEWGEKRFSVISVEW
jgi:hypothetical protein